MTKRRIIFHFYLPKKWRQLKSIQIHLSCLKFYAHIFNEAIFIISLDDITDTEAITYIENRLLDCGFTNVAFKVKERSKLFESDTFYYEIIEKRKELDGITFFGHTECAEEEANGNIPFSQLSEWICGSYFLSLSHYWEAEEDLYGSPSFAYGAYVSWDTEVPNKNHWEYAGNFFWINTQKLDNQYYSWGKEIQPLTDRFYVHNFWGNIFDITDLITDAETWMEISSHNGASLQYCGKFNEEAEYYNRLIMSEEELARFKEFKNKMISGLL